MLLSAWEVYTHNNNMSELIESLKIFSTNVNARNRHLVTNGKTPAALAQSKSEIIDFLKGKENKEKEEIKKKQLHIIEILAKENMLDKKSTPLINQMIYKENHLLISAFEIFSVTKDHWEFCETLGLITDIYTGESPKIEAGMKSNEAENASQAVKIIPNSKDERLKKIFEEITKTSKSFTALEMAALNMKLQNKDEFLFSSLELYEQYKDKDDLFDNLRIILKK
jgi:vacuolar-type H+-ATPase catalytic subunit A/Vma1